MQLIDMQAAGELDPYRALESGNIVFFPKQGSGLAEEDKQFMRSVHLTGGKLHKNVSYKPALDRVTGFEAAQPEMAERLLAVMRAYSQWAIRFTASVLPLYQAGWKLDYASFRPEEEQGRDLPWKKRNDLLHVDAFPTRPTHGGLILRVFTNINASQPRVWMTSDPFAQLAPKHAASAGLDRASGTGIFARGLKALGLPVVDRSPYDSFMLGLHDYMKRNEDYQTNCPKYRFDLPPGSTWMVFTDIVPHAVLSGQFALEQTFIVSRASLSDRALAPVSILESLIRRKLTARSTDS